MALSPKYSRSSIAQWTSWTRLFRPVFFKTSACLANQVASCSTETIAGRALEALDMYCEKEAITNVLNPVPNSTISVGDALTNNRQREIAVASQIEARVRCAS